MSNKEKDIKLSASEKRAQKRRETAIQMDQIFGTGRGSVEPSINPLDYTASLMRALNYYNSAFENKDKRRWFMSYVGKNSSEFDILDDWEFRSVGTIIRLKQRDQPLQDKHLKFIDDSIAELKAKAKGGKRLSALKGESKTKDEKPMPSIQDRAIESASIHIGEINGLIDEFIVNDAEIDIVSYLKSNSISPQVSKHISKAFNKTLDELNDTIDGNDKQLVEGYSHLKKVKLKKFIKYIEAIQDACLQQAVTAKAERKPRARKEKPASVLAAKVRFMKEFDELKLKSESPAKIVGASECWIYNTKYKKLQIYSSQNGLSIKGTTILNYDVATSSAKTIRKPELLAGYSNMTKRTLAQEFKSLKTKQSSVNGRINDDCVILKVFA